MWRRAAKLSTVTLVVAAGMLACGKHPSAVATAEAQPQVRSAEINTLPPPAPTAVVPVPGAPISFVDLVKHSRASVVNIHTTALVHQRPVAVFPFGEDSPFYHLVRPPDERSQALGSGFIVSADGEIITNNHVVAPEELGGRVADEIIVQLEDKRQFKARVLARDPATEVALLKIDAQGLSPIKLGDSDAIEVGEWVVAIGEPFGLQSTVTAGIVSAKGRRGDTFGRANQGYWDFIQTDAAINPGNSGGPLLNMRGEVVGINTAIRAQAQGLAFAVPINMVRTVIADLKHFGRVQRGWLGIKAVDPRQAGLNIEGALVAGIYRGGPAHRGGLQQGDLIVKFDDVPIDDAERLRWLQANAGVGKTVQLVVRRQNQTANVTLKTVLQPDQLAQ
jgi:serine protease Do